MYFGTFTLIVIILTKSGQSNTDTAYVDSKPAIAIFDKDNTKSSRALKKYLTEVCVVKNIEEENVKDELYNRNVAYVLTIRDGFEQELLEKLSITSFILRKMI